VSPLHLPTVGKLRTMLLGAPGGGGVKRVGTQAQLLGWLVLCKRGQQRARLLPSRAVTLTWTTPVRIRQAQGVSLKALGQCLDIILGGYNLALCIQNCICIAPLGHQTEWKWTSP